MFFLRTKINKLFFYESFDRQFSKQKALRTFVHPKCVYFYNPSDIWTLFAIEMKQELVFGSKEFTGNNVHTQWEGAWKWKLSTDPTNIILETNETDFVIFQVGNPNCRSNRSILTLNTGETFSAYFPHNNHAHLSLVRWVTKMFGHVCHKNV